MSWKLFRWVWRLEGPLFIGMTPSGALNRCRLYVPARTLWGTVTAELARADSKEEGFPAYEEVGRDVSENCRFTYLYPAEKVDGKYLPWLPEFRQSEGLIWRRQDDGEKAMSDRNFRRSLLDARASTAIDPENDSAAEATLRETEYISPYWRSLSSQGGKREQVFLVGYVFLKEEAFCHQMESKVKTLFVGGDTRYGFGKIRRVEWDSDSTVFGKPVHLDGEDPAIQSDVILGHALATSRDDLNILGAQELLGGWNRGNQIKDEPAWMPGSCMKDDSDSGNRPRPVWLIGKDDNNIGYWSLAASSN